MGRKAGSHAEKTGPQVRAAALKLFAQKGYAAVSMRQIAGEIGVQAGALYLYTPDKQTLLFDLLREHLEQLLAALQAENITGTPIERLEAFCNFHVGYHIDRYEQVFISNMELRNLDPDNFVVIEGLRREYEKALEEILREGNRDGSFRLADARVVTMALLAMMTGAFAWYREGGRLSRSRVQRIYWNLVRRSVGA